MTLLVSTMVTVAVVGAIRVAPPVAALKLTVKVRLTPTVPMANTGMVIVLAAASPAAQESVPPGSTVEPAVP